MSYNFFPQFRGQSRPSTSWLSLYSVSHMLSAQYMLTVWMNSVPLWRPILASSGHRLLVAKQKFVGSQLLPSSPQESSSSLMHFLDKVFPKISRIEFATFLLYLWFIHILYIICFIFYDLKKCLCILDYKLKENKYYILFIFVFPDSRAKPGAE